MALLASMIAGVVLGVVASVGIITLAPDTPDKTSVSVCATTRRTSPINTSSLRARSDKSLSSIA